MLLPQTRLIFCYTFADSTMGAEKVLCTTAVADWELKRNGYSSRSSFREDVRAQTIRRMDGCWLTEVSMLNVTFNWEESFT